MQIKITAERLVTVDLSTYAEGTTPVEAAQQAMDHAPDLLYDSPDTVYRYEIVAPEGAPPQTALALIEEVETLLKQLKQTM